MIYIRPQPPNGGAAREALTSVLSKIGSPLPLPEQPKTPAHERANIRGRAFFCGKESLIRCSQSERHDYFYQCFLNFTQKKTPRRVSLRRDFLVGVPFPCISRFSPVHTGGVWLTRNLPPQSSLSLRPLYLKNKINDTLQPSSYGFSAVHNATTNCFYC